MGLFDRIAAWLEERLVAADPSPVSEGVDLNPATGLPTIAGAGTPDVAGNPYGVSRSHDHDWQRDDRWESSGHDHYHHHDSWSAGSHDPWRD